MNEQQTASPELQLFFKKLIEIKNYCEKSAEQAKTAPEMIAYDDIWSKLNELIKDERTGASNV